LVKVGHVSFPHLLIDRTVQIAPATVLAPMAGVTDTFSGGSIRNLGGCGLIVTNSPARTA